MREVKEGVIISIIVPVYNTEDYLVRCIESILSQSFADFELILVDDGSSDRCPEICDEYSAKDNRIRVFHKNNGGVSSARNLGLEKAKGEFICFVDSDDTVGENYLQQLIITGDEDMVQGNCTMIENDFLKPIMTNEKIFADFSRYWRESSATFVWSNCYRNSVIQNSCIHFNEEVRIGEDELFNMDYLLASKKIRRIGRIEHNYSTIGTSAVHKLYLNRLQIEVERTQKIGALSKNKNSFYRILWYYWNIVLKHYYAHLWKDEDQAFRPQIRKKIKETYRNEHFRQCLPYMRKFGTVDEKIEACCMSYYTHCLYGPILKMVQAASRMKKALYRQ